MNKIISKLKRRSQFYKSDKEYRGQLKAFKKLRNTIVRYEGPTRPVGVGDWEVLKKFLG